ncbi:aminotransferase class I/II-fold pyridoxal phosphate-dependent enzyme [Candidatus Electronema sp. TJ]|uniref:aminotransferase class I/II-fold pyridoxal phosphate-dependent enzyme n=1 Tax=Candidatus Electronema sp. TJ TaxID=3401573 RepID=UPI003AA8E085
MLDFTSALYLGMRHPHSTLKPWRTLTTGRPAALEEPLGAAAAAQELAQLIGCESGALATSTLHVFWDIFEVLAQEQIALFIDSSSYPIARWGAERAAAKGVPLTIFPQHNPAALERSLLGCGRQRPVVLTDGLDPATGRLSPLPDYLRLVQERGGWLIVDDTQALGILGRQSKNVAPYGSGGGGAAAWHGLRGPRLIVAASLAKGFGAPLAVLAGSRDLIARYKAKGLCRVHCSAPSAAAVAAANHALQLNQQWGARLRQRLAARVRQFRSLLAEFGFSAQGGLFPVQTLRLSAAEVVHRHLEAEGIWTVLHQTRKKRPAQLSFLLSAEHEPWEIEQAAHSLAEQRQRQARTHHHEESSGICPRSF